MEDCAGVVTSEADVALELWRSEGTQGLLTNDRTGHNCDRGSPASASSIALGDQVPEPV